MKLSERMEMALNKQLNEELASAYIYLAMSAALAEENLLGAAHWMRQQSAEELAHAMKMHDFIEHRGGRISFAAVAAPPSDFKNALQTFRAALAHEQYISDCYNRLVALAMEEMDFATNNLIQWFVAEQVEEEATLVSLIQQLELIGNDGPGLYMIDRELLTRVAAFQVAPAK